MNSTRRPVAVSLWDDEARGVYEVDEVSVVNGAT